MLRSSAPRTLRALAACALVAAVVAAGGCSRDKIVFVYPDEAPDFRFLTGPSPTVWVDAVDDLRPREQREGEGRFFKITYPGDEAWEAPPTVIYAEALAQDLEQTSLLELVPLRGEAEYILSADLLDMGCRLERSPWSLLITGGLGAGLGMVLGEGGSHSTKLAVALGVAAMVAVPVPTTNRATAEVRLTLKDTEGNVVWTSTCRGEHVAKKAVTPTARQDQRLVDEHLTKAVKKANACLLGQLSQFLQERAATP